MKRPDEDRAGGVMVTDPVIAHRRVLREGRPAINVGDEVKLAEAIAVGLVDTIGRPRGDAEPRVLGDPDAGSWGDPMRLPTSGAGW